MPGSEVEFTAEAGVSNLLPLAKLSLTIRTRLVGRGAEVLSSVAKSVGGADILEARTAESEELDTLVARAVIAGAESALLHKRQLLARVVSQAVLDDARIDEAALIVDILSQIDAAHVRALEAIHRAEVKARISGETAPIAPGAEKPLVASVQDATASLPDALLRRITSLDLISATITWDGLRFVAGLTSLGERILEELKTVTSE